MSKEMYQQAKSYPSTQTIPENPPPKGINARDRIPPANPPEINMIPAPHEPPVIITPPPAASPPQTIPAPPPPPQQQQHTQQIIRKPPEDYSQSIAAQQRAREYADLQRHLMELEEVLRQRDDVIAYHEGTNNALSADLNDAIRVNSDMKQGLMRSDQEKRNLEDECQRLNLLLLTMQGQLDEWRTNAQNEKALTGKLEEMQHHLRNQKVIESELQKRIAELESQLPPLTRNLTTREEAYSRLEEEYYTQIYRGILLATELDRLSRVMIEVCGDAEKWESKFRLLENHMSKVQAENNKLLKDVSDSQVKNTALSLEVHRLAKRQPEDSQVRKSFVLITELERLAGEVEELRHTIQAQEHELDMKSGQIEMENRTANEMEAHMANMRKENERLKSYMDENYALKTRLSTYEVILVDVLVLIVGVV